MINNNGITFGICTYNRKEILLKSVNSLRLINGFDDIDIRVYDDCSDDFDIRFLEELFPKTAHIVRNNRNLGADRNTSLMYEDFLKTDNMWLFNADSDLIYRKDLMEAISKYKSQCDGIISFYNSFSHNDLGNEGEELVIKDNVGAAGCLIRRDIVEVILHGIKNNKMHFDIKFSKFLRNNGLKLYATKHSYVQHIGVNGFNSRDINFDYGKNFLCDSIYNATIIESTFENYIESVINFRKRKTWKVYYFVISIHRRIKKLFFFMKIK